MELVVENIETEQKKEEPLVENKDPQEQEQENEEKKMEEMKTQEEISPSTSAAAAARYIDVIESLASLHDNDEIEIVGHVEGEAAVEKLNKNENEELSKQSTQTGNDGNNSDVRNQLECVGRDRGVKNDDCMVKSSGDGSHSNNNDNKTRCSNIHISMSPIMERPQRKRAKLDWFYILPIFYFCLPAFVSFFLD